MDALRGLAALAIQASDFGTALEFHVRLIDLGERSPEVLYNAGLMYEKAAQLEKAVRLYREALSQQPDMPEALLNLGRILESNGKSDEARTCWSKALEVEPALRRQGLAKFLLTQILLHLQEQFYSLAEVQVREENAAAVQLLGGLGFKEVDRGHGYLKG